MTADARIRPGTLDDNYACAAVLVEAINDLGRRNGTIDDASALDLDEAWPRWEPFFEHIGRTAAEFWVAEGADGTPAGYARSIDRGGLFELTEFFVRPDIQAQGLGRELLARAFPLDRGDLRLIVATTDVSALSRYLRSRVLPRFPVVTFTAPPREAGLIDGLEIQRLDLDANLDAVHAIDDAVLGHRREVDHRWFVDQREGYRYMRDGRVVGYGYVGVGEGRGTGPFAVLEPADLPAVLSHAERRSQELGISECSFDIAMHNRAAVDHLLDRGYRMDPFLTLICSSQPFGQFDRYVFCAPAFTL